VLSLDISNHIRSYDATQVTESTRFENGLITMHPVLSKRTVSEVDLLHKHIRSICINALFTQSQPSKAPLTSESEELAIYRLTKQKISESFKELNLFITTHQLAPNYPYPFAYRKFYLFTQLAVSFFENLDNKSQIHLLGLPKRLLKLFNGNTNLHNNAIRLITVLFKNIFLKSSFKKIQIERQNLHASIQKTLEKIDKKIHWSTVNLDGIFYSDDELSKLDNHFDSITPEINKVFEWPNNPLQTKLRQHCYEALKTLEDPVRNYAVSYKSLYYFTRIFLIISSPSTDEWNTIYSRIVLLYTHYKESKDPFINTLNKKVFSLDLSKKVLYKVATDTIDKLHSFTAAENRYPLTDRTKNNYSCFSQEFLRSYRLLQQAKKHGVFTNKSDSRNIDDLFDKINNQSIDAVKTVYKRLVLKTLTPTIKIETWALFCLAVEYRTDKSTFYFNELANLHKNTTVDSIAREIARRPEEIQLLYPMVMALLAKKNILSNGEPFDELAFNDALTTNRIDRDWCKPQLHTQAASSLEVNEFEEIKSPNRHYKSLNQHQSSFISEKKTNDPLEEFLSDSVEISRPKSCKAETLNEFELIKRTK